ncbi:hypothetical protein JT358_01660 [Micrococcales bacterium 31B]|nr:hypothetical protein [Micrococcales bacterium 31B]
MIPSSSVIVVLLVVVVLGVMLARMVRHAPSPEERAAAEARRAVAEAGRASRRNGEAEALNTVSTMSSHEVSVLGPRRSPASIKAAAQSRNARRLRATSLIVLLVITVGLIPFAALQMLPWVAPLVPAAALVGLVVALRKSDVRHRVRLRQAYELQKLVVETQRAHRVRAERETREVLDRAAAAAAAATGNGSRAKHARPQPHSPRGAELLERAATHSDALESDAKVDLASLADAASDRGEAVDATAAPRTAGSAPTPGVGEPDARSVGLAAPAPVAVDRAWLAPLPPSRYAQQKRPVGYATVLDATETAAMRVQESADAEAVQVAVALPRPADVGGAGNPAARASLDVTQLLRQRRANAS